MTRTCGFSPTRAILPGAGPRWCTAASPACTVTKEQGIRAGLGESSEPREPREPRLCARPAARTRPLPARHSAPRASTARGAAEPSRRAASAPGSPWPQPRARGESARWPRCLGQGAAGAGDRRPKPRAPEGPPPAASRRPTLSGRTCAVRSRSGGAGSGAQHPPREGEGGAGRGGGGKGRAQECGTPGCDPLGRCAQQVHRAFLCSLGRCL